MVLSIEIFGDNQVGIIKINGLFFKVLFYVWDKKKMLGLVSREDWLELLL